MDDNCDYDGNHDEDDCGPALSRPRGFSIRIQFIITITTTIIIVATVRIISMLACDKRDLVLGTLKCNVMPAHACGYLSMRESPCAISYEEHWLKMFKL